MDTSKQRSGKQKNKVVSTPKSAPLPASVYLRESAALEDLVLPTEIASLTKELGEVLVSGNPRAILFGAPGLGKTATIMNMAATSKRPFWWVKVEQFAAALTREGGFDFRTLFAEAAKSNAVLIFDDFDGFVKKRDERFDTTAMRAAVAGWLAAMDEFAGRIAILATTNLPGSFEPAMFRRFDRLLHYKRLGDDDLRRLLKTHLRDQDIPQSLLMEARQLSPAELVDMAESTLQSSPSVADFEGRVQQRLRAIRIAGIPAH